MPRKIERQLYLVISLVSATIFWLGESLMHFIVLDNGQPFELIPGDFNELWMRTMISALVVLFGLYVQRQVNKRLDVKEEKMRTLKATMNTVQDRVGNTLFGIKMMLGKATRESRMDEETYRRVVAAIDETVEELDKLSASHKVNEKQFQNGIYFLEIEK